MRVMLCQINPIVGDIKGNTDKITQGIERGKAAKVDLVVFPELAITGYPPEDFLLLNHFIDEVQAALDSIIKASKGINLIVGTVRRNTGAGEKNLFNTAAILKDGVLAGFQDKTLLPTYDVFDERRFFEPSQTRTVWEIAGQRVGVLICEDIWQSSELVKYSNYASDPILELAKLAPDLAINLSASPFSYRKLAARLQVSQTAGLRLGCPLLLCNQVGGNDSLIFDGRSICVDQLGRCCGVGKGFQEEDFIINTESMAEIASYDIEPIADLYGALVMGIRDYFHKSGFKKACLGLSGGIDSAIVACLAVAALGKENVLGVLMPSRYSSEGSLKDAYDLAKALDISTEEISIEGPFASYLSLLEPLFKESGKPNFDATEENLQARIRGMILMALSNKFGYIVLSTGNKSELAMGYSTLYGDMCGGLGVLSDVTKEQVYSLAGYINRFSTDKIIPESTINKPPSAELRPNQKDSDSLPDYAIVDRVLEAYIEGHEAPESMAQRLGYSIELVKGLVARIHANEYKRRQGPLGLRVSEKAFSIGRRFPIVQKYV